MTAIPFPLSSAPGRFPYESAGRLKNAYSEPLIAGARAQNVWRRAPGLAAFATSGQVGFRGGALIGAQLFGAWAGNVSTISPSGAVNSLGAFAGTKGVFIARNNASPTPDVVAVDPDNGAFVLQSQPVAPATCAVAIGGTSFVSGDTISLTFTNANVTGLPITVTYTLASGSSAAAIASGLQALISANATLSAAGVSATASGAVVTIDQQGAIGNATTVTFASTGTGNQTVTLGNGGEMTGGTGTPGAQNGSSPTTYNGGGALPQPNSVCFQDGYFFFTTGDGRCFASGLNSLAMNALTFITCEGSIGGLLRAVPFNAALYLCGPHSIEVWQDTAQPAPGFPYSRVIVIPVGIFSAYTISGFELGFGKGIIFLGSDGIVYALNGYQPTKISTPDVDRAVQAFMTAGSDPSTIQMFPYVVGGHSCVVLTCPLFTWVFDVDNVRWFERHSYLQSNWRAQFAFNAFGRWIAGDAATGNLVTITENEFDEVGSPLEYEIESGPVSTFPDRMAVAIATFDMAQGLGIAISSQPNVVAPTAQISWSDDGGMNWSTPRFVALGQQGVSNDPIRLFKTGMSKTMGRRWRIKVTDAVPVELVGGDQSVEIRQA